MATRPKRTEEVGEGAGTQQPMMRVRERGRDDNFVGDAAPSSPTPAALHSSSSGILKTKKKKSMKANSAQESAPSSPGGDLKKKKKLEEADSTSQLGSNSQTKDKNSEQEMDVDIGSVLKSKSKPKKKTAAREGNQVMQRETCDAILRAPSDKDSATSKVADHSTNETSKKTRKSKPSDARASKTKLDDSAPIESVGTIDDVARSTIDSSVHSIKTTRSKSHQERRREQMNQQIEMHEPHPLDVVDELERPGAHRVDIDETHDEESNTIFLQEPHEDRHYRAAEGATVTAWVVEAEVTPGSSNGSISDAENQSQATDLPEAIVQKGLVVWILEHTTWTAILITMFVAAVVVPLSVLLAKAPSDPSTVSPSVAPTTPSTLSPTVAPTTPSTLSPTVAPTTPSTLSPTVAPPTPSPVSPTVNPTVSHSMQVLQILEIHTGEKLDIDNLSPYQLRALTWLVDEDELALDFQSADPIFVVQRYALAAMYYSADGWPLCLQFVSQLDHCNWTATDGSYCDFNSDLGVATGVTCHSNGYVKRLDLCK
jgi:hypothetical protein